MVIVDEFINKGKQSKKVETRTNSGPRFLHDTENPAPYLLMRDFSFLFNK